MLKIFILLVQKIYLDLDRVCRITTIPSLAVGFEESPPKRNLLEIIYFVIEMWYFLTLARNLSSEMGKMTSTQVS